MVIGQSIMPNSNEKLNIQCMLFVPRASKWIYLLKAAGQCKCQSKTMKEGTIMTQNGTPIIIGKLKSNHLHYFELALSKQLGKVPWVIITMLSDYMYLMAQKDGTHSSTCDKTSQWEHRRWPPPNHHHMIMLSLLWQANQLALHWHLGCIFIFILSIIC